MSDESALPDGIAHLDKEIEELAGRKRSSTILSKGRSFLRAWGLTRLS